MSRFLDGHIEEDTRLCSSRIAGGDGLRTDVSLPDNPTPEETATASAADFRLRQKGSIRALAASLAPLPLAAATAWPSPT